MRGIGICIGVSLVALGLGSVRAEDRAPPGLGLDDPDRPHFQVVADSLHTFDGTSEGWQTEHWPGERGLGEPCLAAADVSGELASEGRSSLVLPVDFPRPSVTLVKRIGIEGWRYAAYDVHIPSGTPGRVRSVFFVKDKDGLWFQALSGRPLVRQRDGTYAEGRSEHRLAPGAWNTVSVDLRCGSGNLVPEGHLARWNARFAQDVELVGIALFGDKAFRGEARLDNFRAWTTRRNAQASLYLRNLEFPKRGVGTHDCWEVSFELNQEFSNPFDAGEVRVEAVFTTPAGVDVRTPGFFYQDYSRRLTVVGEELRPVGPGLWKVRYAPRRPGTHRFRIEVQTADQKMTTRDRTFEVTESDHPGFMRVSKLDPRCFEFENGDPFYPIGHNVHSPVDERCAQVLGYLSIVDQGTFTYDRLFERMASAGENFVEIWMSSWWLGIEWTRDWKGYRGLGRYNLGNAWRLDYLLREARRLGLRAHLVIDNHGKYSAWCDPEWQYSPYNKANSTSGGFLDQPNEFFASDKARKLYRQKMRYILARWGWDATIAGIELISELDLTGKRGRPMGRIRGRDGPDAPLRVEHEWHRDMIRYFKTVDAGGHLCTTHYSGDFDNVDPVMARLSEIGYVVCDAYRVRDTPFAGHAIGAAMGLEKYGKPFLVTEYGGTWSGADEPRLEADLHCGMWSSYMTSAAGTPLLWWSDFVDRRDLYHHFRALSNFARGEDRRDPEFKTSSPLVRKPPGGESVRAVAYMTRRRAYAWAYVARAMRSYPRTPIGVEDVSVRFRDVDDGTWDIEVWDTLRGNIIAQQEAQASGGGLTVKLPDFSNDVALKLRRREPRQAKTACAGDRTEPALPVVQ